MSDAPEDTAPGSEDPGEQRRLQRQIDRAVEGMVLYESAWCPFCMRVDQALKSLGIELQRADIKEDPEAERQLIEGGGQRKVPCLYIPDGDSGQWLYESSDIIDYLRALVEELSPQER